MSLAELSQQKNMQFLDGEHIILRLTYISRYNNHNENDELQKILSQAQSNNAQNGITGALVFNHNYFLQSIEGARPMINELLRKLIKDDRHFSLQIIEAREIDQRRWTRWSMKYLSPNEQNKDQALKFSGGTTFNPYLMSTKQIMMLIDTLSKIQEKQDRQESQVKPGLFGRRRG